MPAKLLRMIAVTAVCFSNGASAVAAGEPRHTPASVQGPASYSRSDALKATRHAKQNVVRTQVGRNAYVDPAAPYKANRPSTPRAAESALNIPGQTTVLTREVLDDMKATSVRDALRSTAGVTVGR